MSDAITATENPAPNPNKKKVSPWIKIFAFFIILTMVGWVLAAYISNTTVNPPQNPNQNTIEISGYSFAVLNDGTFVTEYETGGGKIPIQFRLDPREAANISLGSDVVPILLSSQKLYMTSNPNQPELGKIAVASAEISRILSLYSREVIPAFIEDTDPPTSSVPLRTCEDVALDAKINVIYLHLANKTEVYNENGCVHVTGTTPDELILAADKLGYNLIGIKI